jgi:hypothetical protein
VHAGEHHARSPALFKRLAVTHPGRAVARPGDLPDCRLHAQCTSAVSVVYADAELPGVGNDVRTKLAATTVARLQDPRLKDKKQQRSGHPCDMSPICAQRDPLFRVLSAQITVPFALRERASARGIRDHCN